MTNGELVVGMPTWLSLTMGGSNLSSNVMAGVGVSELVTSSTPLDCSVRLPATCKGCSQEGQRDHPGDESSARGARV